MVRDDAAKDLELEKEGKARAQRVGHRVRCDCIQMWRVLRKMDKYSGASADASAVAVRFGGLDGEKLSGDNGDEDTTVRRQRSALQARPVMGSNAAKQLRHAREAPDDHAQSMVEELGRSRQTMNAMVAEI